MKDFRISWHFTWPFWSRWVFAYIHDGKIMYYRPDCHRDKLHHPTWVSALLQQRYQWVDKPKASHCLFGLHQLENKFQFLKARIFDQGPLGIPKGDACLSKKATRGRAGHGWTRNNGVCRGGWHAYTGTEGGAARTGRTATPAVPQGPYHRASRPGSLQVLSQFWCSHGIRSVESPTLKIKGPEQTLRSCKQPILSLKASPFGMPSADV